MFSRSAAIPLGGVDERLETAEDNDFGYRWLRAGRPMSFEPRLVVWHHDCSDPRRGILRGLPARLVAGWRVFR